MHTHCREPPTHLAWHLPLPDGSWLKGEGACGRQQEQALNRGEDRAPVQLPAQTLAISHMKEHGEGVYTCVWAHQQGRTKC
jgi:hypothetical protein